MEHLPESTLQGLPHEIRIKILTQLSPTDLDNVARVGNVNLTRDAIFAKREVKEAEQFSIVNIDLRHPIRYILQFRDHPRAWRHAETLFIRLLPSQFGVELLLNSIANLYSRNKLQKDLAGIKQHYPEDLALMRQNDFLKPELDRLFAILHLPSNSKPAYETALKDMNPMPALLILLTYTIRVKTIRIIVDQHHAPTIDTFLNPALNCLRAMTLYPRFAQPHTVEIGANRFSDGSCPKSLLVWFRWPGVKTITVGGFNDHNSQSMMGPPNDPWMSSSLQVSPRHLHFKQCSLSPALLIAMIQTLPNLVTLRFRARPWGLWNAVDPGQPINPEGCYNPEDTAMILTTHYHHELARCGFRLLFNHTSPPDNPDGYGRYGDPVSPDDPIVQMAADDMDGGISNLKAPEGPDEHIKRVFWHDNTWSVSSSWRNPVPFQSFMLYRTSVVENDSDPDLKLHRFWEGIDDDL